jgi:hypothetical protein
MQGMVSELMCVALIDCPALVIYVRKGIVFVLFMLPVIGYIQTETKICIFYYNVMYRVLKGVNHYIFYCEG